MSQPELVKLKQQQEASLVKKQEALIHVTHALAWLQHTIQLARRSTPEMSYGRLAVPLLLLSGRRATEILNGMSTFTPTDRPTTCLFSGQIKKRGAACEYEIPLLCDDATFRFALGVLREKQKHVQLDARACNHNYSRLLSDAIGQLYPFCPNVHALRGIYAAFAFHLYVCNTTFNRAAMRMLGHEKLDVSLAYNAILLHDLGNTAGCYGALFR